jgi:hypothetical protein
MTKSELRAIIKECISEVYGDVNEAAIDAQDMTKKSVSVIKDIIKGLSNKIKILNNSVVPLSAKQLGPYVFEINNQIKERLVDTNIVPCPIIFVKLKEGTLGGYGFDNEVYLNVYYYLAAESYVGDGYFLIPYKDIKFDEMYRTIEHELIHYQQNERSKGKAYNISDKDDLNFSEKYKDIIKQKKLIAPKLSDEQFINYVKYYNNVNELNTFAKDAVNKYVKDILKDMRSFIRNGGLPKKDYSSEEVKSFVLSPLLNSKTDIFNEQDIKYRQSPYNISRFKQKLINSYEGYKYLTAKNKKKWWIYVYQSLMNMKFEPLTIN